MTTTTRTRSAYQPAESAHPQAHASEHGERLLDQAIAESFPASDPISPAYESSLEPVLLGDNRSRAVWKRRLRKATPSLIAIGSAAIIALVAVYVLRDRRTMLSDWRDYIPWKS